MINDHIINKHRLLDNLFKGSNDKSNGHWVTVNGRHMFVDKGGKEIDLKHVEKNIDRLSSTPAHTKVKTYRYGGDSKGDVQFSSKEKDYSEEYAKLKGGTEKDVEEIELSHINPLEIELPPNEFSSPAAEDKYIKQAKENGNDVVIFKEKGGIDIFYAEIKQNKAKAVHQAYLKAKKDGSNPELVKQVEKTV